MDDLEFQYFCPRLKRHIYFDFYLLLNVDRTATIEHIKKSYKQLARELHPDKCPLEKKELSKEKFKIIHGAYTTLIDPEKRAAYDHFFNKMELKKCLKNGDYSNINNIIKFCQSEDVLDILIHKFRLDTVKFSTMPSNNKASTPPAPVDPTLLLNPTLLTKQPPANSTSTKSQLLNDLHPSSISNTSQQSTFDQLTHHNLNLLDNTLQDSNESSSKQPPNSPSYSSTTERFYSCFSFLSKTNNNDQPSCFKNFTFLKDALNSSTTRSEHTDYFSEDDECQERFKYMCPTAKQENNNNGIGCDKLNKAQCTTNSTFCNKNAYTPEPTCESEDSHFDIDMESFTPDKSNCLDEPDNISTKCTNTNRHELDDVSGEKIVKRVKSIRKAPRSKTN